MNRVISALLITALISIALPTGLFSQENQPAVLTNETVVKMLKDGLAETIVIAKIKASETRFDTSAEAMNQLKQAGVSDAVLLAMVEAPGLAKGPPAPAMTTAAAFVEVPVSDGLEFEVELARTVSGQDMKLGDIVDFIVTQPVVVNGVTIIEKGAPARGHITTAKKAGRWGKAGKLEWAMKDVLTVDGTRVPVRFTKRTIGDSKGGTVAVAAVATTVLLGPLGLLWGLKKGKPAIIPAGNRYPTFIHGDTTVKGKPVMP
jgi:hypothetical protein